MALMVLSVVLGLAAGCARGGRLTRLADVRFRWWGVLVAGVTVQLLGHAAAVAVGTVALVVFAVRNLSVTGMGVVAIGLGLNAAVMALNGGMPVRLSALVAVGIADPGEAHDADLGPRRHVERDGDVLPELGDIVPVTPLGLVVSFGDLIVAAGLADAVFHLTRRRREGSATALIDPELLDDGNLEAARAGAAISDDAWRAAAAGIRLPQAPPVEPVRRPPTMATPMTATPPAGGGDTVADGPATPPWGVIKLAAQRLHQRPAKPKHPAERPKVAMDSDEPWDAATLAALVADVAKYRAAS